MEGRAAAATGGAETSWKATRAGASAGAVADAGNAPAVFEGHRNTDGPAVNERGEMFFSDPSNARIHRAGPNGKASLFAERTNGGNA